MEERMFQKWAFCEMGRLKDLFWVFSLFKGLVIFPVLLRFLTREDLPVAYYEINSYAKTNLASEYLGLTKIKLCYIRACEHVT